MRQRAASGEGENSPCWFLRDIYRYGGYGMEPDEAKARQWDELAEGFRTGDVEEIPIFGEPLPGLLFSSNNLQPALSILH